MASDGKTHLSGILQDHQEDLLAEWLREQSRVGRSNITGAGARDEAGEFLRLLAEAARQGDPADTKTPSWREVRDMLAGVSQLRARQGFTPSQTALFVLSLKRPVFARLRRALESEPSVLLEETEIATDLLDALALWTVDVFQKSREDVIQRQQAEMQELSTPVVKLSEGIIALPLIGTLDSARTLVVMESLLEAIVEIGAEVAILDITGVPTVDTLVSQYLLKTVAAARLMGADCIISGIRPQIAQTIVQLGVDLSEVTTRASLADALALALRRTGRSICQVSPGA